MKLQKINIVFLITGIMSFLIFGFLVAKQYAEMKTGREVIKTCASVLFPIPIGLYARTLIWRPAVTISTGGPEPTEVKRAVILLFAAMISILAIIGLLENTRSSTIESYPVLLHLINSSLVNAYVVNEMTSKNLSITGIVSGLIIGLASYIFFL